uniref:Uncharacterized protein n=1 Tax=Anguilla anguilla TaxID=7936 RepID=A0A0E9RUG4_ANGAN
MALGPAHPDTPIGSQECEHMLPPWKPHPGLSRCSLGFGTEKIKMKDNKKKRPGLAQTEKG